MKNTQVNKRLEKDNGKKTNENLSRDLSLEIKKSLFKQSDPKVLSLPTKNVIEERVMQ